MKLTELTDNQVVHCKTEDEAIRICNIAHELGWKWCNKNSYKKTNWGKYFGTTCYDFDNGAYGNLDFYLSGGKQIINSTKIENMKNVLPTYFIIERDLDNPLWKSYISWLNETYREHWEGIQHYYYGVDGSVSFNGTNCYDSISEFKNNPILITLDFWNECVNGGDKKQTYPVEAKDMKQVFDIACKSWKEKLAKEFASQMMLGEVCLVTEELKQEMLDAATAEQRPIVKSLFEEDLSVDISETFNWFLESEMDGEYKNKGFILNNKYNWEIIIDIKKKLILVPTKKSAKKN